MNNRRFHNQYECTCGTIWMDDWDSACNDRCPACGTETEPYLSTDRWDDLTPAEIIREYAGSEFEEIAELLDDVHALVDGKEWEADSTSELCDLLTCAGYKVNEPDEGLEPLLLDEEAVQMAESVGLQLVTNEQRYPKLVESGATLAVELGPDEYLERRHHHRDHRTAVIEYVRGGQVRLTVNFWTGEAETLIRDIAKDEEGSQAQGFVDLFRREDVPVPHYPLTHKATADSVLGGTRYKP